ncbi:MAG: hypothetical protein KJP01_01015 [Gramella sp.]|nr:hypothetical protein [Christiangramia sp.]
MKTIRNFAVGIALVAFSAMSIGDASVYAADKEPIVNERPFFRTQGDRVILNLLNLDLDLVKLKVIDQHGRVLYRAVIEGELVIEKSFNFENAYEGIYRVMVISAGETYSEKIIVS